MNIKKEVQETLKSAILRCGKKAGISVTNVRIMVSSKCEKCAVEYHLMNRGNVVSVLDLKKDILDIGIVDLFNKVGFVSDFMKKAIVDLAVLNNFPIAETNVRIYCENENAEPSFYLFRSDCAVKPMKIEEFLNF
jgi:hypothetical protein